MELNSETIKELDSKKIYDMLGSTIDFVYTSFPYLSMSKESYYQIVIREIDKSKKKYDGNISYQKYIRKNISNAIHDLITLVLNNSSDAYGLINAYINYYFENITKSEDIIKMLVRLSSFFSIHKYSVNPDILIELLNKNQMFSNKIKVIVDSYYNEIVNGNAENVFDNEFILLLVEIYCNLHDIKIKEEDYSLDYSIFSGVDIDRYYLMEMGRIPLLTNEEERELAVRIANGDKKAKDKFIESNLRLVVSIARRYQNRGLSFLDLVQEGNIGLMTSVERYNLEKGYRFSTYATWWIRQAIVRGIAEKGKTIRYPVHWYDDLTKYNRIHDMLKNNLDREPTIEEVAKEGKMQVEQVKHILQVLNKPLSINALVSNDSDTELENFIIVGNDTPEEEITDNSIQDSVRELLEHSNLKKREKQVLRLRFGIEDGYIHTLEDIGKSFNLTRERIRQIEAIALKKLILFKGTEQLAVYMDNPDEALRNLKRFRDEYYNRVNLNRTKTDAKERKERKVAKIHKTLQEIFSDYSKEQIKEAVLKLSEEDKELVWKRYGDDLDRVFLGVVTSEEKNRIRASIIPRLGRMLANPEMKIREYKKNRAERIKKESSSDKLPFPGLREEPKKEEQSITQNVETEVPDPEDKLPFPGLKEQGERIEAETATNIIVPEKDNTLSKDNGIKILELLRTPTFKDMLEVLSPKEAVIISLKLGYVDGKYFTNESIANFLGISEDEVRETLKKILLLYKDNINEIIDHLISLVTSDKEDTLKLSLIMKY